MGRGRAKAKQTKVARELKYSSHGTDLDALRAELSGSRPADPPDRVVPDAVGDEDDDLDDPYAVDEDDEADEPGAGAGGR
jgi:Protein of unknown function (DUF3073)